MYKSSQIKIFIRGNIYLIYKVKIFRLEINDPTRFQLGQKKGIEVVHRFRNSVTLIINK